MNNMNETWLPSDTPLPVLDAFQKAAAVINSDRYKSGHILCSISGGGR